MVLVLSPSKSRLMRGAAFPPFVLWPTRHAAIFGQRKDYRHSPFATFKIASAITSSRLSFSSSILAISAASPFQ